MNFKFQLGPDECPMVIVDERNIGYWVASVVCSAFVIALLTHH